MDSCAAEPVCQNKTYTWDNLDNAALNTEYMGDASKYDWVYSGFPNTTDGNLLMTMPKESVGTLFANNHYIWYGKISGKIKSSRGKGVVTAFILLSDTKDEVDFEFVGADLDNVQTNYYFQGILDCMYFSFTPDLYLLMLIEQQTTTAANPQSRAPTPSTTGILTRSTGPPISSPGPWTAT